MVLLGVDRSFKTLFLKIWASDGFPVGRDKKNNEQHVISANS